MRPVRLAILLLLWAALLVAARPAGADVSEMVEDLLSELQILPLDGEAPAFALQDPGGRRHALADARGRVVLLYFWASW